MRKSLSDMTMEELWQLFPIILSEPRDEWAEWYLEESGRLYALFPEEKITLSHIGSTAIKGILAKPIVDILAEIPDGASMNAVKTTLTDSGYICMSEEKDRKSFNRGYTDDGFAQKVFHLHLRYAGDNNELYFRDYMNDNPDAAKEYEALKLGLWKQFEHNRDAYTMAKGEFVTRYTQLALEQYGNRYR